MHNLKLSLEDCMKVLYVALDEDDKICTNGDCKPVLQKSGEDALKYLDSNEVDLILVGSKLSGETGVSFLHRLSKSNFKNLPVIYIYDNKNELPIEQRFALGIIDYISKSELTPGRILGYLDRLLEQDKLLEGVKKLSIAVIDDSRVSLKVISTILNEAGITDFKTFQDPRDLIISGETFDAYFIDMVMPGITGDKLVAMMRGQSPKSIIISMSSIDNVKTISNVLSYGADDYIIKPFNKEVFIARLKTNFRAYNLMNELDRKNYELELLSKVDSLTGAYNHGHIFKVLNNEIERATYQGGSFSLLIIDLDFFKEVNDNYGHVSGDEVLITLSELFLSKANDRDFFGRYGGEEFLYIMGDTSIQKAIESVSEIHREFASTQINGIDRYITFSGGLVQWSGESVSELVRKADDLLYEAKKDGRNNIKW